MNSYNETLEELRSKYETVCADRDGWRRSEAIVRTERDELRTKYDDLVLNTVGLPAYVALGSQCNELRTQCYELQTKYEALLKESDELRAKYEAAGIERDELRKKYDALLSQQASVAHSPAYIALRARHRELRSQLQRLLDL